MLSRVIYISVIQETPQDWTYTGTVTAVKDSILETIEGNTNEGRSTNGIAAVKRIRNYTTSKLDVFSIEPLVSFFTSDH